MVTRRALLAGIGAAAVTGTAGCSDDGSPDGGTPDSSPTGGDNTESPQQTPTGTPNPAVDTTIVSGVNVPWSIIFAPDNAALVSERDTARIVRITPDTTLTPLGEVPGVEAAGGSGEGGLLGLALAPDDPTTLFAYMTTASDNRVVSMAVRNGGIGKPQTVLEGIPASTHHNGGQLRFGPDGMLYVSTGDAGQSDRAQDTDDLGGKILRIRPDGRAPNGNPFGNEVWSYGHRNVEGLAFDHAGRLWSSEFGDAEADELNLIEKGENYGWPTVEGTGGGSKLTDPMRTWPPAQCSPAGIAVTNGMAFLGALRGERLIGVPLNGTKAGKPREWFTGKYGRIRAVAPAPDGSLWVGTSNTDGRAEPGHKDDRILRVTL